jgi:protein kinase C substrate 80K-H
MKVKGERDLVRGKLEKAKAILAALKEGYNPNFNDEGVKAAVRAWEEYLAQEQDHVGNKAEERDLDSLLEQDEVDWDGFLEGADDAAECEYCTEP